MSDQKRWHAWAIKRNRLDNVIAYIRDKVPEVDQFFYPQIKVEYPTKRGVRVKERPLYEGYIYLRYHNDDEVYHKLNAYPFITTSVGLVSKDEILRMQDVEGKLLSDLKASRFSKGDPVTLLKGPFKGFDAVVEGTKGDKIRVKVEAKILGQSGVGLIFTEDQVERKTELQNVGVQDI